MARPVTRTRSAPRVRPAAASLTPRTLFLASLGAALVARREAERLAADAADVPQRLRAGADAAVDTACAEARKLARTARTRIAPLQREAARLGAQIDAARIEGVAEAAKRLNPLLARVGLPKIPTASSRRPARKPTKRAAGASPARRPTVKKAAKATRRRA